MDLLNSSSPALHGLGRTAQQMRQAVAQHSQQPPVRAALASAGGAALPHEIVCQVASFASPQTARTMRAVSAQWFDAVHYGNRDLFVAQVATAQLQPLRSMDAAAAQRVLARARNITLDSTQQTRRNPQYFINGGLGLNMERNIAARLLGEMPQLRDLTIDNITPFLQPETHLPIAYKLPNDLNSLTLRNLCTESDARNFYGERNHHVFMPLYAQALYGQLPSLQHLTIFDFCLPDRRMAISDIALFSVPLQSLGLFSVYQKQQWDVLLRSNFTALVELSLSHCLRDGNSAELDVSGAQARSYLSELFGKISSTLTSLQLAAHNSHTDVESTFLAAPLLTQSWRNLHTLSLENVEFDGTDEISFFSADAFPALQKLTLVEAVLGSDPLFLLSMRRNNSLRELSLFDCEVAAFEETPWAYSTDFGRGLAALQKLYVDSLPDSFALLAIWMRVMHNQLLELSVVLKPPLRQSERSINLLRVIKRAQMPRLSRLNLQAYTPVTPAAAAQRHADIERSIRSLKGYPSLQQVAYYF